MRSLLWTAHYILHFAYCYLKFFLFTVEHLIWYDEKNQTNLVQLMVGVLQRRWNYRHGSLHWLVNKQQPEQPKDQPVQMLALHTKQLILWTPFFDNFTIDLITQKKTSDTRMEGKMVRCYPLDWLKSTDIMSADELLLLYWFQCQHKKFWWSSLTLQELRDNEIKRKDAVKYFHSQNLSPYAYNGVLRILNNNSRSSRSSSSHGAFDLYGTRKTGVIAFAKCNFFEPFFLHVRHKFNLLDWFGDQKNKPLCGKYSRFVHITSNVN